jgi:hypothetical protein
MSRSNVIRDVWHPQTRHDREAVLAELQSVLASSHFCNSKRYPALLQYIVEKTLAGEADSLKERTLGVEVFERPPSYDTNTDTVVRYTAGEVRKRLSLYYHEQEHRPGIQIALPAGSYIPEFIDTREVEDAVAGNDISSMRVTGLPSPLRAGNADSHWPVPEGLSLQGHVTSPYAAMCCNSHERCRLSIYIHAERVGGRAD